MKPISQSNDKNHLSNYPITFEVQNNSMVDETIDMRVIHLKPSEEIEIKAVYIDADKISWSSSATFKANELGVVSLAKLAPLSGSYKGVDGMGLFWSMIPSTKQTPLSYAIFTEQTVSLQAFINSTEVAKTTIIRHLLSPDVEREEVRENGLVGTMFTPKEEGLFPGVIVIPGAEGGIPEKFAMLLASHGYGAFALGYHGLDGLPEWIQNIPIEYFQKGVSWLKEQKKVDEKSIGMIGNSKGGELSLIYGSTFPKDVQAIVGYVPATYVLSSLNPFSLDPAWTHEGKPVEPFFDCRFIGIEELISEGNIPHCAGTYDDPFSSTELFKYRINRDPEGLASSAIKVENMQAPLLIFSAEDDQTIPSPFFCKRVIEQLENSSIERKHKSYEKAGHAIGFTILPNFPSISLPFCLPNGWWGAGGTMEGNAIAVKNSWGELLQFLDRHLKGE